MSGVQAVREAKDDGVTEEEEVEDEVGSNRKAKVYQENYNNAVKALKKKVAKKITNQVLKIMSQSLPSHWIQIKNPKHLPYNQLKLVNWPSHLKNSFLADHNLADVLNPQNLVPHQRMQGRKLVRAIKP